MSETIIADFLEINKTLSYYLLIFIIICLFLSILVAGSTSATAWLLDPAVKKIFVEKDQTLAWLIPIAIVLTFAAKGLSLYFARLNILKVGQVISGEMQKKIAKALNKLKISSKIKLTVDVDPINFA